MKHFLRLLVCLSFFSAYIAPAQVNTAKTNFIKSGMYFSPGALKNYKGFYGDSLKGFDEEAIKSRLLNDAIYGAEYMTCMANLKREFIIKKYNLHGVVATTSANPVTGGRRQIGGNNTTTSLPCINEGFENTPAGQYAGAANATAISGWTISSYTQADGLCATSLFTPGSPELWVRNTPILNVPYIGTLPNSPFGGNTVVQLNDIYATGLQTRLLQTFPVTTSNSLYQIAFAAIMNDGGHPCCTQAAVKVRLYDCNGALLSCASLSLTPPGSSCPYGTGTFTSIVQNSINYAWTNWQTRSIDLMPFIGSCVTIEIIASDCTAGGHLGCLYFDSQCGSALDYSSSINYCPGSNQAVIQAPQGYSSYQWVSPTTGTIPANMGGTATSYTVTNPVANSVYSVALQTASGCHFIGTYTLASSSVNILSVNSGSACAGGGTNGTATITANGSGTGYNYTWTDATNSVVGTSSVLSNVPAGVYTVSLTAIGSTVCGSASSTVLIGTAPANTLSLLMSYCGTEAYLQSPLTGTNFRWYNGTTLIPAAQGGTASSYTAVITTTNIPTYWLSYHTYQGCQDSVKFILNPSVASSLTITNSLTCPGSLGSAVISLTPVPFGFTAANSFSVFSTGTTPAYSATTSPSSVVSYTAANLPIGGTYSVSAFDGSCYHTGSFSINLSTPPFNFSITPSATLCAGTTATVGVTINTINAYTYSWSPASYVYVPNLYSSVVLSPTLSPGTTTTIAISVIVTPTAANCPQTQSLTLTYLSTATPTLGPVPTLCGSNATFAIAANPAGGTFYSGTGSVSPVNSASGVISASLANAGTNTFTYAITSNSCAAFATGTYVVIPDPVISPVPVFCGAASNYTIAATPAGGNFTAGSSSAIGATSGIISASLILPGINTFTYSVASGTCNTSSTGSYVLIPSPVISPVPALCSNAAGYTITAFPQGGSFYTTGSSSPIGSTSGILSPALANTGVNTFTYALTSGTCTASATASYVINAAPVISIAGRDTICNGESASLIASGADAYVWNSGLTGLVIVVSPSVTTVYTTTGTATANNCAAVKSKTVTVEGCTGIHSFEAGNGLIIYPNPVINELSIEAQQPVTITLYNELGSVIREETLAKGLSKLDMSSYSSGIYFLKTTDQKQVKLTKIIKVKD